MHFPSQPFRQGAPLWRTCFTLALLPVIAFALAAATPRPAVRSGLAYDEVTKLITNDQAPQPGNFAADFQAAVDAQRSMADTGKHRGLFGSIMNAADMAKGAYGALRSGAASSNYYWNGWRRTDDVGAQTATISKPDRHQIIYLNLAKKTYRIADTSVARVPETPAPYERSGNPQGQAPQPGSGKLDISVSSQMLGPKTIENVPTIGYRQNFKLSATKSTGSCVDGGFQTTMTEYISAYVEPSVTAMTGMRQRANVPRPERMVMRPGCTPSITMHASQGPSVPGDRLAMWVLMSLSGGAQTAQGAMSGGFQTLIERGHVRTLGPADASLFEIPRDFTPEQ